MISNGSCKKKKQVTVYCRLIQIRSTPCSDVIITMQSLKVVIVGDPGAGKTRLATSFHTRGFPGTYVPNVFDNQYSTKYLKHGISYTLGFWDTNGHEDHNRLRPLAYPQTDVFLVCFDVTRRESYLNVKGKWLPELRHHLPEVSVLLVATKIDLRSQ